MLEDFGLVHVLGLLVAEAASSASLLELHAFTAVDVWRTAGQGEMLHNHNTQHSFTQWRRAKVWAPTVKI